MAAEFYKVREGQLDWWRLRRAGRAYIYSVLVLESDFLFPVILRRFRALVVCAFVDFRSKVKNNQYINGGYYDWSNINDEGYGCLSGWFSGQQGTIFAFDQDQGLSEHTAPFDAMVYVLDGEVEITISGEPRLLKEGEMIIMPGGKPHALKAVSRFKMMLVMIKS